MIAGLPPGEVVRRSPHDMMAPPLPPVSLSRSLVVGRCFFVCDQIEYRRNESSLVHGDVLPGDDVLIHLVYNSRR